MSISAFRLRHRFVQRLAEDLVHLGFGLGHLQRFLHAGLVRVSALDDAVLTLAIAGAPAENDGGTEHDSTAMPAAARKPEAEDEMLRLPLWSRARSRPARDAGRSAS